MYMRLRKKNLIFRRKKLLSTNWVKKEKKIRKRKKRKQKKKVKKKFFLKKLFFKLSPFSRYMDKVFLPDILYNYNKVKLFINANKYTSRMKALNNRSLFKYFIKKFKFFNKSWRQRAVIEQKRYPKEDWGVLFPSSFESKLLEGKNGLIFPLDKSGHIVQQYVFLYFLNNLMKKLNYNDYLLK